MADGGSHFAILELGARECYDRIAPLLPYHYEELAKFKDIAALKPDLERYLRFEQVGALLCLVADLDGELVGYSVNVLQTNLHYSDLGFCQNDVLYVAPEHRRSRAYLALRRETLRRAKARGAALMLWHAKEGTPLNEILPRQGCVVLDVIWAERL